MPIAEQKVHPKIDRKYVWIAFKFPKLDALASIVMYIPTTPFTGNPVIIIDTIKNYQVSRKSSKKLTIDTSQTAKGKKINKKVAKIFFKSIDSLKLVKTPYFCIWGE